MERSEVLREITGFWGLPPTALERVASVAVIKRRRKKEILFAQGDPGEGCFVVVTGQVKIYKMSSEGKEVIFRICRPGDLFAQVTLFSEGCYPASAQALSDCELLLFPRATFLELIGKEPQLALSMLGSLSMRMRQLTTQIEGLALKEVPGRLATYLIYLHEKQGSPDAVVLESSKGQLAAILGTTPETLSRIFANMTERGLLRVERSTVLLINRPALLDLAEQGRYEGR